MMITNCVCTKIFLYTKGVIGGSKELKELFIFMENSIRDNAVDEELSEIMNIVDSVKSDPEERRRYMGIMGVIDYEKRDAYNKGHSTGFQEGLNEGLIQGAILNSKFNGTDREKTRETIMKQFSLEEGEAEEYMLSYWDEASVND